MRLCFSSLGCPELSLAEMAALARRFDLSLMELRAVSHRLDLPRLFGELFGSPARMKAWLADQGVAIASLDASHKLAGGSEESFQELLEFGAWADALGVPWIRVFDGGRFQDPIDNSVAEELEAGILRWRGWRLENGWSTDIMVETHDALCSAKAIQSLQSRLDQPVQILWDSHHTWKKAGEPIHETWDQIASHVPHIHFKDSVSKPSARHPFTYVHLGEGEFDLPGLLRMLASSGFEGVLSLEWERQWHPYLDPIEVALERMRGLFAG